MDFHALIVIALFIITTICALLAWWQVVNDKKTACAYLEQKLCEERLKNHILKARVDSKRCHYSGLANDEIDRLNNKIGLQQNEIATLENQIKIKDGIIKGKDNIIDTLRAQIAAMENT